MVRSGLTAVLKWNDEIFDFLDDFKILYGFLTRPPLCMSFSWRFQLAYWNWGRKERKSKMGVFLGVEKKSENGYKYLWKGVDGCMYRTKGKKLAQIIQTNCSVHQKEEERLTCEASGIRTIPVVITISSASRPSISYILSRFRKDR